MPPPLRIEASNRTACIAGGHIVADTGADWPTLRVRGELRPGLINAHDHLHRNHYGRLGEGPYPNAYAWGDDIQRRHAAEIAAGRALPRREALLRGAWKNLRAGVTTVVHHDPWEADFERDFPLRVARVHSADALGRDPARVAEAGDGSSEDGLPFSLHLAEGTDRAAAEEVRELGRLGLLNPRLLAVHCVGVDADGVRRLRASGAAVVWCPSSNRFLLGRTLPAELVAPGQDVLLGSDSLLSAAGDLLDELRAARGEGLVEDARLLDAVGAVAARRLGIAAPSLEPGAPADLAVFTRPLLEARAADVALVMVGGVVRVAAAADDDEMRRLGIGSALARPLPGAGENAR